MSKECTSFNILNMKGKRDTKKIKRELDAFPGVLSVSVNAGSGLVGVDYDSTGVTKSQLINCLANLGYDLE